MGIKKAVSIAGLLAVSALVMSSVSCAGSFVGKFSDGRAVHTEASREKRTSRSRVITGVDNLPTAHARCASICEDIGGPIKHFVFQGPAAKSATCECYEPLVVTDFGKVGSAEECGKTVGQAGFLRYIYDGRTGQCSGRGPYKPVGTAETTKECAEMVKAAGQKNAVWDPDSKKCVAELPTVGGSAAAATVPKPEVVVPAKPESEITVPVASEPIESEPEEEDVSIESE